MQSISLMGLNVKNRQMRKMTKKLSAFVFVIALSLGSVAFASENDNAKVSSNLLKKEVDRQLRSLDAPNTREIVDDILGENVRKHHDSSLYKLILVNDKILNKYQTINYGIN